MFQTYSASISFGYLAHKDFKNIRIFAVRHVLRSPQSQCLFFIILTKVLSEGNCYASPAPHTALDTRHIGTIFRLFCTIYCSVVLVHNFNKCSPHRGWVGCVIPPFLFQTYSASISFGYLAHKDFRNIRIFAVRHVLRSPQSPCLFLNILT